MSTTPPATDRTPAHLFVIRGDISKLACDAWLLPTDARFEVTRSWRRSVPDLDERVKRSRIPNFGGKDQLATELLGAEEGGPVPVLTAVPLHGFQKSDELVPSIRSFIEVASEIANRRPNSARSRALVALPFFGTAGGGGQRLAADVLRTIFTAAREGADEAGVDVALVLRDPAALALAQKIRREDPSRFDLTPQLLEHAKRLGGLAREGRLVPFMGAGISVSAGSPTWKDLLIDLRKSIGVEEDIDAAFDKPDVSPLDAATILSRIAEEKKVEPPFNKQVGELVERKRWGLAPALLALLATEGAITLNYDTLFESASADAGVPRRVFPGNTAPVETDKWLLKLHGSSDRPETIVLTRDDYLGFDADRAALSSLVKATLMTKHMLFVGFGLKDDHFHEIVHDVRKAVSDAPTSEQAQATVLKLRDDPLDHYLWAGVMEPVSLDGDDGVAAAARRLEILLDAIACFASDSHSYLLTRQFEHGLSKPEQELREKLLELESLSEGAKATSAWHLIERMLTELGASPPASSQRRGAS